MQQQEQQQQQQRKKQGEQQQEQQQQQQGQQADAGGDDTSAAGDDEASRRPQLLDYVTPAPGSELGALAHKVFGRVVCRDPLSDTDPKLQVRACHIGIPLALASLLS